MQTHTAEVKQVKTAGFMKRNVNKDRIEQEEKELQKLMSGQEQDEVVEENSSYDEDNEEPTSSEEKTFKKRYGDLRRHAQKKEEDFQKQIDALKSQLEDATKSEIKYPKTEEEIEAWTKKYPDVAKIIETLVMKRTHEHAKDYEDRFKEIDSMREQALREKAEAELMRIHPDFDDIRESDEFHDWVEEQPRWVQDALYDNNNDAVAASRAIDLYKSDKGIRTKKKSSPKDAASSIGTRGSRSKPESDSSGKTVYESEVQRMSAQEYEKHQERIAEAIRTQNFVYDISGSAR
jgi:hypothetical protein